MPLYCVSDLYGGGGRGGRTAGMVSNIRGSVRDLRVSASMAFSSRIYRLDELSVRGSVTSGRGLSSAVAGRGFSKSSGGLLISTADNTGYVIGWG